MCSGRDYHSLESIIIKHTCSSIFKIRKTRSEVAEKEYKLLLKCFPKSKSFIIITDLNTFSTTWLSPIWKGSVYQRTSQGIFEWESYILFLIENVLDLLKYSSWKLQIFIQVFWINIGWLQMQTLKFFFPSSMALSFIKAPLQFQRDTLLRLLNFG